jgi:NAD(P)H-hydrate epimerase
MQLFTAAQTRELDRIAIEEHGISGIRLMTRAGQAAFDLLLRRWPDPAHLHVFCGVGNNGGDGYIVAALAAERGIPTSVYQVGDAAKIRGDALEARVHALSSGVDVFALETEPSLREGVIVDALLGTGLSGEVRPAYAFAIGCINNSGLPVLALDVPSGLCSDTGRDLGSVVKADCTITFIACKRGLLTGAAVRYRGDLEVCDLEVPAGCYAALEADGERLDLEDCLLSMPPLPADAHKGLLGSAVLVGGDHGFAGACAMAAEAAARCGAGLVSVATRPDHVAAIVARRPEVMARGIVGATELVELLSGASAVAVGPGLGQSPWSEQLLHKVLDSSIPLVVDADALNMMARLPANPALHRENWILTPHPGEAARLLQVSTVEIEADRFAAVRGLQQRYGGVVILKGSGTLVCAGQRVFVSTYGNPGMASGGMGDVLSGVLVSLLAQGLAPLQAACLGVCLHGQAADLAAGKTPRGLLATDLMPHLRQLLGA